MTCTFFDLPCIIITVQGEPLTDWGQEVCGLLLGYDQNVLMNSLFNRLLNGLWYYSQPFRCPTTVEHLGLDCKVEYMDANQGIMPETHTIWVYYRSNIGKVASITPSKAEFHLFLYYISAGLLRMRSSNFRSVCPPEHSYAPSLRGARRPNNGY
jgi:hypothetical protein